MHNITNTWHLVGMRFFVELNVLVKITRNHPYLVATQSSLLSKQFGEVIANNGSIRSHLNPLEQKFVSCIAALRIGSVNCQNRIAP